MGVGEHRANRSSVRERRKTASLRKWPIGSDNMGQTGERYIENRKQIVVPLSLDDVEELCTRSVTGLDRCAHRQSATEEKRRSSLGRSLRLSRAAWPCGRRSSSQRALAAENIGSSGNRCDGKSLRRVRQLAAQHRSPRFVDPAMRGLALAPLRCGDPISRRIRAGC